MTIGEMKSKQKMLMEQLKEITAMIEEYGTGGLCLKDREAMFRKWSLAEQNRLYVINDKAYQWFIENPQATIEEYNSQQAKHNKIVLE